MKRDKKAGFKRELTAAKMAWRSGDLDEAFRRLERAHVLGQRWFATHLVTHWWMFLVGIRRRDWSEVRGQISRMLAVVPGYFFGWVPKGNTGGANVSPVKPMPVSEDLQTDLGRYSVAFDVAARLVLFAGIATLAWATIGRPSATATPSEPGIVATINDLGSVRRLEILPLVNWHAKDDRFRTEAGVAYLIKADDVTILIDLGLNGREEHPSPLLANMDALGIDHDELDAVFLTHPHRDHVGGKRWADANSFALTPDQKGLAGLPVFAPTDLVHPSAEVRVITGPELLLPGIASTGPIERQLFIGKTQEQSLVVHVEGRGLIAFVGCGHQTVPALLERIEDAFDLPLHGIAGDLHYPLPEGRLSMLGIDVQRRLASGGGPLSPLTGEDVSAELAFLSDRLGFLALGGHDTSDQVLDEAPELFGDRFHRIRVGEPIVIEGASSLSSE